MEWPTLYKHLPTQYVEGTLKNGLIRIGTLSDFRKTEIHNEQRGDEGEGTIERYIPGDFRGTFDNSQKSALGPHIMLNNVEIIGFEKAISVKTETRDSYIYCTSLKKSRRLMDSFGGSNVCLEIRDSFRFFRALSQSIEMFGSFQWTAGKCVYMKRDFSHHESPPSVPVCLLKPKRYENQREFRMAWEPLNGCTTPFMAVCPAATALMRIVHV